MTTASKKIEMATKVGEKVFIRGVTHHYTGRLATITVLTAGTVVLTLTAAAWIADDGRFSAALASGDLGEIEPYPDGPVDVYVGSLCDVSRWPHALPREVK